MFKNDYILGTPKSAPDGDLGVDTPEISDSYDNMSTMEQAVYETMVCEQIGDVGALIVRDLMRE